MPNERRLTRNTERVPAVRHFRRSRRLANLAWNDFHGNSDRRQVGGSARVQASRRPHLRGIALARRDRRKGISAAAWASSPGPRSADRGYCRPRARLPVLSIAPTRPGQTAKKSVDLRRPLGLAGAQCGFATMPLSVRQTGAVAPSLILPQHLDGKRLATGIRSANPGRTTGCVTA